MDKEDDEDDDWQSGSDEESLSAMSRGGMESALLAPPPPPAPELAVATAEASHDRISSLLISCAKISARVESDLTFFLSRALLTHDLSLW